MTNSIIDMPFHIFCGRLQSRRLKNQSRMLIFDFCSCWNQQNISQKILSFECWLGDVKQSVVPDAEGLLLGFNVKTSIKPTKSDEIAIKSTSIETQLSTGINHYKWDVQHWFFCHFTRVGTYVQRGSKFCFVLVLTIYVEFRHYCEIGCISHHSVFSAQ
jgi:hypothetical protein